MGVCVCVNIGVCVCLHTNFCVNEYCLVDSILQNNTNIETNISGGIAKIQFVTFLTLIFIFKVNLLSFYFICKNYLVNGEIDLALQLSSNRKSYLVFQLTHLYFTLVHYKVQLKFTHTVIHGGCSHRCVHVDTGPQQKDV